MNLALLLAIAMGPAMALAQPTAQPTVQPTAQLTEDEAVRRALARPELTGLVAGALAAAEARAAAGQVVANPSVAYGREHLPGEGGEAEQSLTISQVVDLSDARALRAEAAFAGQRLATLDRATRVRALTAAVRYRFHDVLYRQSRELALKGLADRLRQALRLVEAREKAGDASAYERQRLTRELRGVRSRLTEEAAERDAAWVRLVAWTGEHAGAWPRVAGPLRPGPVGSPAVPDSPALAALEVEAEIARLTGRADAAGRSVELGLQAGLKTVAGQGDRRFGYVAGASLTLPLFDSGSAAERLGEAKAMATLARRAVEKSELAAQVAGLAQRANALSQAATQLQSESAAAQPALVRTAEAAYAGGELGLLELLDAHRGVTEDNLRILDLELAARRSVIALRASAGEAAP